MTKRRLAAFLLGALLLTAFWLSAHAQQHMEAAGPDIVIHGGRIIDGTGNPWYVGDVAITDGRIVALGKIPGGIAKRVIEANGMVVAPGFIDMLGQSETALLIDNRSISKLAQGITSEITGEGGSIAPQNATTIAAAQPSLDPYHLKIDWTTLDQYWQRLAKKGTPINIGTSGLFRWSRSDDAGSAGSGTRH